MAYGGHIGVDGGDITTGRDRSSEILIVAFIQRLRRRMFLTGRQSRRMLGGLGRVIGTDAWSRVAHGLTIPEEDVRRLHYPDQKATQAIIA